MRYLTVEEILEINAAVLGGAYALRDRRLLESAVPAPFRRTLELFSSTDRLTA